MRILLIGSKEFPIVERNVEDKNQSGGIERYVEKLAQGLKRYTDLQLVIITRKFKSQLKVESENNLVVYRVMWVKGIFLRNPSFNFVSFLRALSIDFDLIHSHGPIAGFFGSVLSKITHKPLIYTPHGISFNQPQYNFLLKKVLILIEKINCRTAARIIFVSKGNIRYFGFINKQKIDIIHPGVDESFLSQQIQKSKSVVTLIFVGRLNKVKGIEYLIRSVPLICSNKKYKIIIVGDGVEKNKLIHLSRHLRKKIVFLGHKSHKEIRMILGKADVFVMPSLSEGFPMTLLEAMACGCTCVVSELGIDLDDRSIIKVKPKRIEELANALSKLINDEKFRKKMIIHARRKARKFSWEKNIKKHYELYKMVLR